MNIEVSTNIGDKFLLGLEEVLNVIDSINRSDDDEDVIIFQNNIFVTPLFILPLLVYVNGCNKRIRYQYSNNYLNTIQFGNGGLKPDELESGTFHDLMDKCSFKTYIPIISFSTDL